MQARVSRPISPPPVAPALADEYPEIMFTPVTPRRASIFLRFISQSWRSSACNMPPVDSSPQLHFPVSIIHLCLAGALSSRCQYPLVPLTWAEELQPAPNRLHGCKIGAYSSGCFLPPAIRA